MFYNNSVFGRVHQAILLSRSRRTKLALGHRDSEDHYIMSNEVQAHKANKDLVEEEGQITMAGRSDHPADWPGKHAREASGLEGICGQAPGIFGMCCKAPSDMYAHEQIPERAIAGTV